MAFGGALELFELGGPLMWAILLCSLFGAAVFAEGFSRLRKELKALGRFDLDRGASGGGDALVEVLSRRLSAYRGYPLRDFLELASRERELLLGDLSWKIEALSLVARSAPLLGLLGTVLGMISLFRRLPEAGPGDVALLSSGIWEAVLTTAFGLAVAVPALAAEHALEGMTRRLEAGLERACLEMLKGGDGEA